MKHKRKIFSLFLALIMIVTLVPVSAYADTCQHNWGPWEPGGRTPVTCTESGSTVRTCSLCGSREYGESGPLGHAWDNGSVTTAATCTTAGVRTFTCTRCGATRTEQIPATGQHSWDGGTVTTAATCTAAGVRTFRCTSCGQTRTENIPATGHSWDAGTVTTPATCTAAGVRTFRCTSCGQTRTETIAATGHTWDGGTVTTSATCTAAGVRTFRCTACGQTRTENIAALGHDWDTTGSTEPTGLTEGVSTRTCRRCGETETTTLPVNTFHLFGSFRNIPPGAENAGDLVITQQPEGGVLDSAGTHYMAVEVSGGQQPYTYEWHYVTEPLVMNALDLITNSNAETVAESYHNHSNDFADAFNEVISSHYPSMGTVEHESTYTYGGTIWHQAIEATTFDPNDHVLAGSDLPSYPATEPGSYYCVVRDVAGHRVESDEVEVTAPLHIVEQPQNANIHGQESVELTCRAEGGVPFEYTAIPHFYDWRQDDGTPEGRLLDWYEPTYEATEPGDYFCLVSDLYGTIVRTDTATVYDAEPLWISVAQDEYEIDPSVGNALVEWSLGGGVKAYNIEWALDGVIQESFPTETTEFAQTFSEQGYYTFTVTDAMGASCSIGAFVHYPVLEIAQQPDSGMLPPDGGTFSLYLTMAEGTAPFTYTLYRNGSPYYNGTADGMEIVVPVAHTGSYYFHVEDAEHCWAESTTAAVIEEEDQFRVVRYTEDTTMESPEGCHLEVEVAGGRPPYTYEWYWSGFHDGERTISTGTRNSTLGTAWADQPGYYFCYIWDADDTFQMVGAIVVRAASTAPVITSDPQDVLYEPDQAGNRTYGLMLYCGAEAYDGENENLQYQWQWEDEGVWRDHAYTYGPYLAYSGYANSVCGRYRCVVTDTRTGESVTSAPANVGIKLSCFAAGVIPSSYQVAGERTYEYAFVFAGGRAPYTVELHELRYMGTNTVRSDLTLSTFTVQNANDLNPFIRRMQGQYDYYLYSPDYGYIRQSAQNQYYLIVTDADGQPCTSGVVDSTTLYS